MMTVTTTMSAREYLAKMLQEKYGFPKEPSFTFAYEINDESVRLLLASHQVSVAEEPDGADSVMDVDRALVIGCNR